MRCLSFPRTVTLEYRLISNSERPCLLEVAASKATLALPLRMQSVSGISEL